MMYEFIIAILPAVVGSLLTYYLTKKSNEKTQVYTKKMSFWKFTRYIRINAYKLFIVLMNLCCCKLLYDLIRFRIIKYLPDITNESVIVIYVVYVFISTLYIIDRAFNSDGEKIK